MTIEIHRQPSAAGGGAPLPELDPVSEIRQQIRRLSFINCIHTALRFTLNVEDIHAIILTTMISHPGLDFSRAILLGYDETRGIYRGIAALGAVSREKDEQLHQEVAEEERCLAEMVRDLSNLTGPAEEEPVFRHSLHELAHHSFWITTYQRFSTENELMPIVQLIEIPGPLDLRQEPDETVPALLRDVIASETSFVVSRERLEQSGISAPLAEVFPAETLWVPIRTQKGVRLILVADKIFQEGPITALDLVHVDWFIGQVALALENAEMYKDLEVAYNSLRELDRMKSNFLATISHELRTPLTAINGYVQLLLGNRIGALAPGQREVLERIYAHSEHLTGKVNDLIEIAEVDSGRSADSVLEPVEPLTAITAVMPRVEPRRAHKGITIEPVVNAPVPRIRASREAVERIFFHLIDNAIKFGHVGGHIWIEFETGAGELRISIADDGIGISNNQMQKIFDAFYQVDNQLTRSYEGLGIGLAVIKRQLAQTGGRIFVNSTPGQGSRFTVVYPLANAGAGE